MLPRELLKEVRKIEIRTRHLVDSVYSGGYRSVFKGRGIEFAGIRQYIRGDEFRSIDWKVSARMGSFQVREHIEERELQVIIALDLSGSMAFGSGAKEKRETAVEFAAAMAMSAARSNDRVGICLSAEAVEKFLPPAKGQRHILRLIRELLYFLPEKKGTDLRPALDFLNHSLVRRSIIFLVTDGIELPPMDRQLRTLAAHHDVIIALVQDVREQDIPDVGLVELEDPETGAELIWDTSCRRDIDRFKEAWQEHRNALVDFCRRHGIDILELTAGESVVRPICRLFSTRERRFARKI